MKFLITIAFASLTYMGFTQAPGFYGKKFMVGTEGFGCIPLLNGFFKEGVNYHSNGKLVNKKELFNYGYGIYCLRALNKNRAAGIEVNRRYSSAPVGNEFPLVFRDGNNDYTLDTLFATIERTQLVTSNFLLRFEFSTKNSISPFGFSHYFGLGFGITSLNQTYAHYQLKNTGNSKNEEIDILNYTGNWQNYRSVVAQYGISMRYALTRKLALDVGVKYMINYFLKPSNEAIQESNGTITLDYEKTYYDLKRKNILNLNAKIGICYLF